MKAFFFSIFALLFTVFASAQDISFLIAEGDKLEVALQEKSAFERFKDVIRIQPANIYALTKCSELCSRIGYRETTAAERNDYYAAAEKFAALALKIEPTSSAANCMMAIALGRISLEKNGKEKVKAAKEIKTY